MGELKKQTVSGIKWLVGSSFLQKVISLATTVVLARILNPATFGLFSLAFIAIDTLGLFKSMGFDSALIRRKDDVEKAANTAFFIIPVLGVSIYLILTISAPMIGRFLNNQAVVGVVRALGIIYVISCFGNVPKAILEKTMQFKKVSKIEISTAFIYSITAIILAISGVGIWCLVIAYITKTLYQNIMFWVFSKWRPRFEFDKKIALEMFHFGKFLFLDGVVLFLKMNLDNLLVGKLLGITALGLYAVAFNLANFVADYFGGKVYRVIFPVFSKIQSDKDALKRAFLKTTKLVSIVAFPFCVVLLLLGDEIIGVIYGQKWIAAIPVLKVLAFAGLFNTIPIAMGILWNATGNSKIAFLASLIQVSIFLLFISPAAKVYGLMGVGTIVALSQLIAVVTFLHFTMKLISLKGRDIYQNLRPGLVASLLVAIVIIFYKYCFLSNILLTNNLKFYLNITVLLILILFSYIASLRLLDRSLLKEIKNMFI